MSSKPLHIKLRDKRNKPPEGASWVWITREVLESEAWRTAPLRTTRFVFRLMVEHLAHGGNENGRLPCTTADCVRWGITKKHVKATQADAIKRGLVYRTEKGRGGGTASIRTPSRFGLGWIGAHDGSSAPNRWKAYKAAAPMPRQSIDSSTHGGTDENGENPSTKNGSSVPTGEPMKGSSVPTGEPSKMDLPPGWRVGKAPCGQVRPMRPEADGKWTAVPIVGDPLVGTTAERAAYAELMEWNNRWPDSQKEKTNGSEDQA
jgi:hypothetical protein